MFIDYEILKLIWWLFIGLLLAGFAVMDGQDMGVGTLLPFIGRTDDQRRVMINSVAPHWDGNQVWFITGGGAIFAAWPLIYATAFSGFYWAMLLVLFALFFRPVGLITAARSQIPHGEELGTGFSSSEALSRRLCAASLSATCSKVFRSTLTTI